MPNVAPDALIATAAAMARFRRHWKPWYVHTTAAFDRLTARCDRVVAAERPELVLQAGVLFAPGAPGRAPYYLYCNHTRALHEAYAPLPGLDPPMPFEAAWRARETAVYRGAEAIFVMSEHVRRSLAGAYGIAPERVHVVGAGPNVAPQARSDVPRERAFLFVGRNFVPKGGPETLEAFAAVRAIHPEAELWIVGGQQPGHAPPGVKLLGRLPFAEVARLYERAFAFVLPTLREAFGLAYLEAMSYGLPCIGTRIEAIPEIIADGETGLLVPTRDPASLAAAMLTLLDEPDRARAMGLAGRRRVTNRFGWDRAVRRMLEVMERRGALPAQLQDRPVIAGEEQLAGG